MSAKGQESTVASEQRTSSSRKNKIVILAKIIGMWLFYNYKTCEMFLWEVTQVSAFTKLIFRAIFDSDIPHSQVPLSFPLLTVL